MSMARPSSFTLFIGLYESAHRSEPMPGECRYAHFFLPAIRCLYLFTTLISSHFATISSQRMLLFTHLFISKRSPILYLGWVRNYTHLWRGVGYHSFFQHFPCSPRRSPISVVVLAFAFRASARLSLHSYMSPICYHKRLSPLPLVPPSFQYYVSFRYPGFGILCISV